MRMESNKSALCPVPERDEMMGKKANVSAEKSFFNRTKLIVGCVRMWLLPHFFFFYFFHFGFFSFASDGRLILVHITCHGAQSTQHTAHTHKCDAIEHKVAKLRRRHYCLGWRDDANDWHADGLERRQKNFVLSIQRTMSISLYFFCPFLLCALRSGFSLCVVPVCSTYVIRWHGINRGDSSMYTLRIHCAHIVSNSVKYQIPFAQKWCTIFVVFKWQIAVHRYNRLRAK